MNSVELSQVKALASKLNTEPSAKTLECTCMLRQMAQETGTTSDGPDYEGLARIAGRIYEAMAGVDEPRFSLHDYADGIANARRSVDPAKLLKLDDEGFIAAVIWLAADKRETYEDREHMQEPLELDIYAI